LKKIILFIVVLIVLAFLVWTYGLDCHTKCQFLSELKRGECRESQEDCFGIFVKSRDCPKGCCCFRGEWFYFKNLGI